MLSPRGQYGLEAKFCGLGFIGFGLGLVLGFVKHWPRSHVSWPRGLNKFLCDTLNEKQTCQWSETLLSVEPVQQLPKDVTY